ncbi:hypothetical protein AMECASPLE_001229 [Ameca splendens]|uniref:Uncharacterized protein n=1 Tax=Ameca splendens TaxID=208324 RepID=A0ABV0XXZ9_9TELE
MEEASLFFLAGHGGGIFMDKAMQGEHCGLGRDSRCLNPIPLQPAPATDSSCLLRVSGPRRNGSSTSRLPAAGRLSPPLLGGLLRSAQSLWPSLASELPA